MNRLESEARRPQSVTLSVANALHQHRHLVITGGPGSGKTTLSRWLALVFAQQSQGSTEALGPQFQENRLPILLELRRFASFFKQEGEKPGVPDLATVIADFIADHSFYPETPPEFITDALAAGRCLLILDGMDEIANLGVRQELTDSISAFMHHPNRGYRENLVLVTSRPHGFREVGLGQNFQLCQVNSFSAEDVASFIHHWYDAAYGDSDAADEAETLIQAIQENPRVSELATNPLLCTIIAIVYRNNRVLPNRRVELYLKCCEALLDTWERNKNIKESGLIGLFDWQTKLELLAPVAYWLHQETERLAAPEEEFVDQLAEQLTERGLAQEATATQEARYFIEVIRDRSGILQGRGDGSLEFAHRTFQEYLAARHMAAQPYPDYVDRVMEHLHEAWWREVHQLVIGYLGAGQDKAQQASQLLRTILDHQRRPWRLWRTFSLEPQTPGWLQRQIHDVEWEWLEWILLAIKYTILLPAIMRLLLGRLVHFAQRNRHLGWLLQREFMVATQGYADCTPLGTTQGVAERLTRQAEELLKQVVGDPGRHEALQPLIEAAARQLAPASPEVVQALIQALSDSDYDVRQAAASSLGELGQSSPEVVQALIQALSDSDYDVRQAAASSLAGLKIKDDALINQMLNRLNKLCYSFDDDVRRRALEVIRSLVDGRPLPGQQWTPIRDRLARRRRIRQVSFWAGLVFVLLLVCLVATWFLTDVDPNNFWVRFLAILGIVIGFVSGVTTIVGWTIRGPGEGGE